MAVVESHEERDTSMSAREQQQNLRINTLLHPLPSLPTCFSETPTSALFFRDQQLLQMETPPNTCVALSPMEAGLDHLFEFQDALDSLHRLVDSSQSRFSSVGVNFSQEDFPLSQVFRQAYTEKLAGIRDKTLDQNGLLSRIPASPMPQDGPASQSYASSDYPLQILAADMEALEETIDNLRHIAPIGR